MARCRDRADYGNAPVDQERGKEWEYRIVAINKSSQGEPCNGVMAVL